MNTFGTRLRLTTFGESHGPAIGGIIDGFPAGFKIDFKKLQEEIDKRKPGNSLLVTQRKESDIPEFLSGISAEGVTLGTPIGFIIRNLDHRSQDYSASSQAFRPNHADFTYTAKFGIRDFRGGGRASARETANWVVAGALAQQWLEGKGIFIQSLLVGAGKIDTSKEIKDDLIFKPFEPSLFTVDNYKKKEIEDEILKAKEKGDSIPGKVACLITGMPPGFGDPVFHKLHASIAEAAMSINAAKGFEYGIGNDTCEYSGTQQLDHFFKNEDGRILTDSNFSGGIQGGISNGMPIYFIVTFKPTPTVMKEVKTVDEEGNEVILKMKGRHDPCVAIRAVPVVKAMTALVIADYLL